MATSEGVTEQFFLISTERKLKQPAVAAIAELARAEVFGPRREGAGQAKGREG